MRCPEPEFNHWFVAGIARLQFVTRVRAHECAGGSIEQRELRFTYLACDTRKDIAQSSG